MRYLLSHGRCIALLAIASLAACADEPTAPLAPGGDANLSRAGAAYRFAPIEVDGARYTDAMGVNRHGHVVGSYVDAGGVKHGFLLRDGEFTPIDYPGAIFTEARGIGPDGEIVGTYRMPNQPGYALHGFLRTSAGEFLPMDYPGQPYTMPQRILRDGTVLGCYHTAGFMEMQGVTMGPGGTSTLNLEMSMHNGATPDLRRIAGLHFTAEGMRGYLVEDGKVESFLVPGSTVTAAWDVNVGGQVVGMYRDGAGIHGFVRTAAHYHTLDAPGAAATVAHGINDRGDVVGRFFAGGKWHGFLATLGNHPSL